MSERIAADDPDWAFEVINSFYWSVLHQVERQIAGLAPGKRLRMETNLRARLPDVTMDLLQDLARRLYDHVPDELRHNYRYDGSDDLAIRMLRSAEDAMVEATNVAKQNFLQHGEADPHIHIRVKRYSISIERVTPHYIDQGR